ncbi:hypothetical protein [Baekduia sp.]|jgi:hypothetical protein|uniref:hypothetical protein n=1 Tax=Baekduia sp. TaxID=2600305 RepID=UPI002E09ED07|nr:hypothetical protein [Baekduia sp.]
MKRTALLLMMMVTTGMLAGGGARAAVVDVRVEGAAQTLFEGPVRSSGNPVRATSDSRQHRCDGTNNGQHPTPGATATGASVEGLRTEGMDFDARWFPGFDDYYVTRFGPDAEDVDTYTFWGMLVDDVFADVGGCQAQVDDGDHVLWAYDAFHNRGFLKLAVAGDSAAAPSPTATVVTGQPLTVSVTRAYGEKSPAFTGVGGVTVAPVTTAANGVETVQPTAPGATTTAVDGTADVIFGTLGWHRIKADAGAGGAIRSDRLDVCVVSAPGGNCGAAPADTAVREAPPLPPDPIDPGSGGAGATPSKPGGGKAPAQLVGAPIIELPRFTTAGQRTGRVGVRWRVLQAGVGVRRWRFSARLARKRSGSFTTLATGTKGTTAQLELGAGQTWTVRVTFTDKLGRDVSQTIGDVLVPLDAGARAVRRSGAWSRVRDGGAWLGAVHRGRTGATLTARLAAGRPTILIRGVRKTADIEVRVGSKRAVYRISGSATAATREIVAAPRARAGTVRVRIVSGTAGVDGLGVRP